MLDFSDRPETLDLETELTLLTVAESYDTNSLVSLPLVRTSLIIPLRQQRQQQQQPSSEPLQANTSPFSPSKLKTPSAVQQTNSP